MSKASLAFSDGDYAENLQATPMVVDGVMYVITARAGVFAIDAASGREIWRYQYPEVPRNVPGFVGNRGVAVGDGKVFFGTKDNYMVALPSAASAGPHEQERIDVGA